MATHSSILSWRIPWTEEPGGLQSLGSQRVKHKLMINTGKKKGHFHLTVSTKPGLLLCHQGLRNGEASPGNDGWRLVWFIQKWSSVLHISQENRSLIFSQPCVQAHVHPSLCLLFSLQGHLCSHQRLAPCVCSGSLPPTVSSICLPAVTSFLSLETF